MGTEVPFLWYIFRAKVLMSVKIKILMITYIDIDNTFHVLYSCMHLCVCVCVHTIAEKNSIRIALYDLLNVTDENEEEEGTSADLID